MSLIPLLFSNWWEDLERPHRLANQHFGRELGPDQLLSPRALEVLLAPAVDRRCPLVYRRPWADLFGGGDDEETGSSTVEADKDKFKVILDVQQFKPDEIDVKVVDRCVVIEAKHEEKKDEHGWISRQFTRKYLIPEQCDVEQVASKLSSDGILTITAPRKDLPKAENERTIKIQHTGKPAIRSEPQSQKESQSEKKEIEEKKKAEKK